MRRIMMSKTKFLKGNNNLKRKNKRLNEKCKSLKESIVKLKKVISVGEDQFHDLCIKAEAADLFSRIMKRKKKTKQLRISYRPALRKFALTLNFY